MKLFHYILGNDEHGLLLKGYLIFSGHGMPDTQRVIRGAAVVLTAQQSFLHSSFLYIASTAAPFVMRNLLLVGL